MAASASLVAFAAGPIAPVASAEILDPAPEPSTLPAYSPRGRPTSYTSLGDSFTAGSGIAPQATAGRATVGCKQSTKNYPRLIVDDFNVPIPSLGRPRYPGPPISRYLDASCSGALTSHLRQPQAASATVNESTTNRPQLDAVSFDWILGQPLVSPAELVTISLGVNDVNLIGRIANCAKLKDDRRALDGTNYPCRNLHLTDLTDGGVGDTVELTQQVAVIANRVATNIADIRSASPSARVLVVGYLPVLPPTTFDQADQSPDDTFSCGTAIKMEIGDVAYFSDLESRVNEVLRTQAARYGVGFIDVRAVSAGHDACTPVGVRWVEPYVGFIGTSSIALHPNAAGHEQVRRFVQRQIPKTVW
ncbi:MAG: SGNH/GDSL hydrolase family protein [Solirubrobacterales bacterium]